MTNDSETGVEVYEESDLILDLTEVPHFQFEKLPTYKKLSCFSLKEVDFAFHWKGQFHFLELKSYKKGASKDFKNKLLNDLPAKAVHSFLMMSAVWSDTLLGQRLTMEGIPTECTQIQPVEIIFALELPVGFESHLGILHTQINAILKNSLHFSDTQMSILLDYPTLCRHFPFIQPVPNE